MKKIIMQACLVAVVSVMAVSANAAWRCKMHNLKGQSWYGTGPSRDVAMRNAKGYCAKNSYDANNCLFNWCKSGQ